MEHVTTWLGSDQIAAPLAIEVHGSPHFTRTVWFRIRREDATLAERRFEPAPARCTDLHAAVGLAIALALKASLLDSVIGARTHNDPHTSQPYRLNTQALAGVAVVPGTNFGASLSLQRTAAERFAARLSILALLGPRGDFQQDQGHFKTLLTIGRLDLCSRLADLRSLHVSACVGITAGTLYVTGEAFPSSQQALIKHIAIANALELDIDLNKHWSLTINIDLLIPLNRTNFVVRDQTGTVTASRSLAAAGALIAIGPALHF